MSSDEFQGNRLPPLVRIRRADGSEVERLTRGLRRPPAAIEAAA